VVVGAGALVVVVDTGVAGAVDDGTVDGPPPPPPAPPPPPPPQAATRTSTAATPPRHANRTIGHATGPICAPR
jgi:hypothetical protein